MVRIPEAFEIDVKRGRGEGGRAWLTRLPDLLAAARERWDFHYGNVLAGEREPWLAIDPMAVAGDPEFGVARLLWRRFGDGGTAGLGRRLDMITETAGLNPERTRAWTLVHCVDYWRWALSVGLTEDPKLCATITAWLLDHRVPTTR